MSTERNCFFIRYTKNLHDTQDKKSNKVPNPKSNSIVFFIADGSGPFLSIGGRTDVAGNNRTERGSKIQ